MEFESANGDVEYGPLSREVADGAGVDAARFFFQLREQLHGAYFGRAGDGAAGEERAEDVAVAYVGTQGAGDGGSHLPQGWVAFDCEKVLDLHAAECAETAEIVAEQVDDHDIFAAVLGIVAQALGDLRVLGRGAAP